MVFVQCTSDKAAVQNAKLESHSIVCVLAVSRDEAYILPSVTDNINLGIKTNHQSC